MNRTKIEWVKNPDGTQGYTWNPITGCLNHINGMCKGGNFPCYAYRLANTRLKERYLANDNISKESIYPKIEVVPYALNNALLDPFHPRFWEDRMGDIPSVRTMRGLPWKPDRKGIFVCDMSDLFGIGIPKEWTARVMDKIREYPEHRFYLLTKQPQNLPAWSPFPSNCEVGVTITNEDMLFDAADGLESIKASTKYLSIEPLLHWRNESQGFSFGLSFADWVIIGACTGTMMEMIKVCQVHPELTLCGAPKGKWTAQPKIEWVQEIESAARKAGIDIFEKDNLKPLLKRELIQEVPG